VLLFIVFYKFFIILERLKAAGAKVVRMLVVDVDNHVCERVEAHKHERRAVANIPTIKPTFPKLFDRKAGRLGLLRRNDGRR